MKASSNCHIFSSIEQNLIRQWCTVQEHLPSHCLFLLIFKFFIWMCHCSQTFLATEGKGQISTLSVYTRHSCCHKQGAVFHCWQPLAVSVWMTSQFSVYLNLKNHTDSYKEIQAELNLLFVPITLYITPIPLKAILVFGL